MRILTEPTAEAAAQRLAISGAQVVSLIVVLSSTPYNKDMPVVLRSHIAEGNISGV